MAEKKSGCRSCLIWMACIFMGLALVVGVATYLGYRQATKFMDRFAQKSPLTLPTVRYSQAELHTVKQRIDSFLVDARAGRTNVQLTLSADELNALVADSWFSNRVYITLVSNTVQGQFSLPFEQLGMPLFSGRYLNGSGTIAVGCIGGALAVSIEDFAVNGTKLPEHYLDWIRKQNFARGIGTNELTKESLQRIARVRAANDQLVFELKDSPRPNDR
jgi:hypothetical protein